MKKKIVSLVLCLLLIFPVISCTSEGEKYIGSIDFWSTYATEKIMQDRTEGYDSVKREAKVDVTACRGEYESTQIIMTARDYDIKSYDVEVQQLTGAGQNSFSKDNITVRHQKYLHVREVYSNNGAPTGWYPDALLPLENVKERKENSIKKDENQGIFITFNVSVEQAAGDYTGSIKITYDGQEKVLPVKLTVLDYTVSEDTHSMSYFNLGFTQYYGELDSTYDMWRKYAEFLTDYRISPSMVMEYMGGDDAHIERYVDEAVDFVKNYNMSTINMPIKEGAGLTKYIVELAKKSIEDNFNYVERIIVKGPDEPDLSGSVNISTLTNYNANFRSGRSAAVTQIGSLKSAYPGVSDEFLTKLKDDAAKIPSIITVYNGRTNAADNCNVDTYCPTADQYNTADGRLKYDEWESSREKWWYTCVKPRPPYPTYHIEDTLVSARALNWMMSEYGVTGNLYWAVAVYSKNNGSVYLPLDDYYTSDASRWSRVNGDGYLLYPGAHYGIYGPVSSIRMEAVRDGNEDYEILYDLRNTYQSLGFSADNVQRYISGAVYDGTQVYASDKISVSFESTRKSAIQLAMLAKSAAGLCVTNVTDNHKGTVTYDIMAKTGFTVKNSGIALTPVDGAPSGYEKYTIQINCVKAVNELSLSVEAGGAEYRLDMNLGGKVVNYSGDELLNSNNVFSGGNAVTVALDGENVKFAIDSVKGHQFIRYTSALLSNIDESVERLVIHFEDTDATPFRMLVKPVNSTLNQELIFVNLEQGNGYVTVDLSKYWAKYGKIEYAEIYFSASSSDNDAKTVNISSLTLYSK